MADESCQRSLDGEITFGYESDGGGTPDRPQPQTHYIIASHYQWSDDKRLDFNSKHAALAALKRLRQSASNMGPVAREIGGKWL
jgi:hypothetical protein